MRPFCLALLGVVITATAPLGAQDSTFRQTILEGRDAIDRGEFAEAVATFADAAKRAEQLFRAGRLSDRSWEAHFVFYMGLARHREAERAGNAQATQRAWRQAADHYDESLTIRPQVGAVLNNLAEVLEKQNELDKAERAYLSAIDLASDKQSFYATNFARFLGRRGEWERSLRFYSPARDAQPHNIALHREILEVYVRHAPRQAEFWLWEVADSGGNLTARDLAVDLLERGRGSESLVALIAVCLSKDSYRPTDFAKTVFGTKLQELSRSAARDPARDVSGYSATFKELLALHAKPPDGPEQFEWWRSRGNPFRDPPYGMQPREAFQLLCMSLGDYHRSQESENEAAASYYECAADKYSRHPSPEGVLRLAEFYLEQNDHRALGELVTATESRLFADKNEFYAQSRWDRIYNYHRSLGIIYSKIGPWECPRGTAACARFQLERAIDVAKRHNREAPHKARLEVDPVVIDSLATGLEKHDAPRGRDLRLEKAQEYLEDGQLEAAIAVLAPLRDAQDLPESVQAEYERLQKAVAAGGGPRLGWGGWHTNCFGHLHTIGTFRQQVRDLGSPVFAVRSVDLGAFNGTVNMVIRGDEQGQIENTVAEAAKIAPLIGPWIAETKLAADGSEQGRFRLLPERSPPYLREIRYDGRQGYVELQHTSTAPISRIPFTITGTDRSNIKPFRLIRR